MLLVNLIPGSGRSSGEGNGYPPPVFLPGDNHGQRRLAGSSPWGRTELDMTEPLTLAPSRPGPFLPHPKVQLSATTRGKNCKLLKEKHGVEQRECVYVASTNI